MRVAFITRSLTGGGAERVVSVLANNFIKDNRIDEVYIIALIEDKITYEIDGKIKYIANKSGVKNKIYRVFQRYSFLKKCLNEINPDIVISFCTQINIYSIFAIKKDINKLIISERNDPNNDPEQKYVRVLRDKIYKKVKNAVFQTPDAMKYFENIINGKKVIIENPIKENLPDRFDGVRDKRIVSVARLTTVKNHKLLINAFKKISEKYGNYILEIYGEGPEKNNLQNLIDELNLSNKVFLKGFSENVHEKINSATCFVLPSNYEGISNSMLEALALGIPTICTDCPIGGARMMIKNMENGILIPVGDEKKLEDAILKIIENQDFAIKISKEATKIRKLLSVTQISDKWINFMEDIY